MATQSILACASTRKYEMRYMIVFVACLAGLLSYSLPATAKKTHSGPAGTKVTSGAQFDIYVALSESKPWADTNLKLNIYATTVVVHQTRKHGRQLFRSRLEAVDADLLDSTMWQVGDFNGDGFDDYRVVSGRDKNGCSNWQTQTWLPDSERFTFSAKIQYLTDARGNEVKSCAPKKQK
jgi:hypothetical protein